MSATKVIVLRCDGADVPEGKSSDRIVAEMVRCRATFVGDEAEPAATVRKRAKQVGWSRRDGAWDYCPEHGRRR